MVALKAHFRFINDRLLNPKRPFEMQLSLGAANFYILVCSEYEGKKGIIQGTHFRNGRKQILPIPSCASIVVCELVNKS